MPSPHMSKKPIRQPYGRLLLFCLSRALSAPIEHPAFKIDIPPTDSWLEGPTTDCGMTCTRIEANEDEPGNVLTDVAFGSFIAHDLLSSVCCPYHPSSLGSAQPYFARWRFFR